MVKNEAFVDTTCTAVRYDMPEFSCTKSCANCNENAKSMEQRFEVQNDVREVCQEGKVYCEDDDCERCHYVCFDAVWYLQYDVLPSTTQQANTTQFAYLSIDTYMYYETRKSALYYLERWPLNSTRSCVYDSENIGQGNSVRLERFELVHYYRAYLAFYGLFGASLLALIVVVAVCLIRK